DSGLIVCTPVPGMLNAIRSTPGIASASRIACRREPGPESLVLVTVKVAARPVLAAMRRQIAEAASKCLARDGMRKALLETRYPLGAFFETTRPKKAAPTQMVGAGKEGIAC